MDPPNIKFYHIDLNIQCKEAKSYLHVSRSTFSLASLRFSHSGSNQHQIDYILFAYKNDEDPQSLKSIYSVKNVPETISEFIN